MTLITRISRLFRADVHYLLDCIEDPEAMLKQAIREMENEVSRDEKTLMDLEVRTAQLQLERGDRSKTDVQLQQSIDASFAAKEEKLARAFVRRKLQGERRLKSIEEELVQISADETRIRERLSTRKEKLAEITSKAKLFEESRLDRNRRRDELLRFSPKVRADQLTEEEVELAFLQEKKRHEEAPAA